MGSIKIAYIYSASPKPKNMDYKSIKFNRDELHAFVLLYVANADMEIDSDEIGFIRKHIKKKKLHEVEKVFEKCNDNECLQIILNHKDEYFSTRESKDELMQEIAKLIMADGEKNQMEEAILMGLKRIL
ncbi:MAG: hypothetical protein DRI83_10745 [Bacteroidetes bacterium]|nr:MAG: hypothetical protein DRI83_10745 [Bacteroidota bacterium]